MGNIITESNEGGGVHGLMTLAVKQAFFDAVKEKLQSKGYSNEATVLTYNNLITLSASTSFGTLSTLATTKTANRLNPYFSSPGEFGEFMKENAGKVFPHHSNFFKKLFNDPRQILAGVAGTTKFNNKPLKELINEIAGPNTMMADVEDDVMLTMTRVHPRLDAIFAKSHIARGESTSWNSSSEAARKNWILAEVALGSASPTSYLPGVELHNDARDDRTIVIDGGQSGWNNPSIPVLTEAAFIYGKEADSQTDCFVVDTRAHKGYTMPHDIIHLHWGTGDFNDGLSAEDAKKNTLLSMKSAIVSTSTQSVSRFSMRHGQQSIKNYFHCDFNVDDIPQDIRPKDDFTLASKEQIHRLSEAGLYAASEILSEQIQQAADLVADAYIQKIEFEKAHTTTTYKDYLKSNSCEIE